VSIKSLPGVVLLLLLSATALARTDSIDEGIDYERLRVAVPTDVEPGQVEVLELFWYGCPHCHSFEPFVDKWLEGKPESAAFVRIPATTNPKWIPQARMYYALELMGEIDRLHLIIFQAVHTQGRRLGDLSAMSRFLGQQGVDVERFVDTYNSMEVDTRVRREADRTRRYGITGVPTVIVNGKYRTSATMAGSYDDVIKVINYLVEQESNPT